MTPLARLRDPPLILMALRTSFLTIYISVLNSLKIKEKKKLLALCYFPGLSIFLKAFNIQQYYNFANILEALSSSIIFFVIKEPLFVYLSHP